MTGTFALGAKTASSIIVGDIMIELGQEMSAGGVYFLPRGPNLQV